MGMSGRLLRPRQSGFNPRSISGLALWLDAADSQTLFQDAAATIPATATNDPVGAWLDKSGNNRHATQATAGNRPLISSENNRAALAFDGSNDKLAHTVSGTIGDAGVTFIAAINHNLTSQPTFLSTPVDLSSGNSGRPITRWASSYADRLFVGVSLAEVATSYRSRSGRFVYALDGSQDSVSSGTHTLRDFANGVVVGSGNITASWSTASQVLTVGARDDNGVLYKGNVCEVLCYGRVLTTAERQRVERYLASKWGITLAPQVSNADAQDWVNRVYANGGTVSAATATAVNTFCNDIDAAGIRDRFYRLNLFCGASDASLNAVRTPLYRGPSLTGTQYGNTTDTNANFVAADYSEASGLKGNGSTKYLDTGLAMTFLGTNQVHMFVSFNPEVDELRALLAARMNLTGGCLNIEGNYNGTTANRPRTALFSSGFQPSGHCSPITGRTQYLVNYDGSQPVLVLGRNVSLNNANNAGAYSGTNTESFLVFAGTQTGAGVIAHSAQRIDAYSVGAAFTSDAQRTAFHNAMAAFRTALGRT